MLMEEPSGTTRVNPALTCLQSAQNFWARVQHWAKNTQKPEFVKSYLTFHVQFLIFSITTRINKGLRRQQIALSGNFFLLWGPAATSQQVLPSPESLNMRDPREMFSKPFLMGMPVLVRIGGTPSPVTFSAPILSLPEPQISRFIWQLPPANLNPAGLWFTLFCLAHEEGRVRIPGKIP